ncbi:probable LRR receptor-like serine/threonine-protein kinase At4g36180 [Dioscorea cayenensis subsp. rotundata]|uniref:Probable LRR receptor-like serine/threonine-protein kinase At4g36180 n=1 Tax=Dioscorea cayennensis subsp. rotundata TaxID=55577 RepID=A0AB40CAL5_DIOCR|nr:probable LRR receptor-like serine/threonine-protein kinase At4g36180 [Dioscorea cayenensis subsp. rotundata]
MASANYKASPPFLRFPSTQQLSIIILLLCPSFMMPIITGTTTPTSTSNTTSRGCIKAEREALLAFKSEIIIYDKVHPMSSWGDQTDECCHWAGVRCDNVSSNVIRLDLQGDDYLSWGLGGNISESLLVLQHLKYLNLSNNCFSNFFIPKWLGSLENLVHLDLRFNCFAGVIPHELGNLTRLRYLNLASPELLKVDDAEWLSDLSSLRYLSMDGVDFSDVNNVMQSLNKLLHLEHVSMYDCSMHSIPESLPYLNFGSLAFMDISFNNFDKTMASIPEWLFRIPNLRHLSMGNSGFAGAIPSSNIENTTSLQFLDLSFNEGVSGNMPRAFGDLCNLQSLDLSGTFMGKSLEDFREAFYGCIRQNLKDFSFQTSSLKGHLPDWFAEFKNLTSLDLFGNFLHGSIPESLGRLSGLQYLDLSYNALNGSIPASLGRLSALQHLDLKNNTLNGSIPASLGRLSALQHLDLQHNSLNGSIPASLGRLSALQHLDLQHNSLNGSIPASLGRLSALQTMDVTGNKLNEPIPKSLGRLSRLLSLFLSNNALNGPIPGSMGRLSRLQYLDLSNNVLNGPIPESMGRLSRLHYLDLSNNALNGSIPESLARLSGALDLTNNSFSRIVASDFVNFRGMLPSLKVLHLSSNNLTGSIPNSFCNLVDLQLLELSNNHLEGVLPNCWNNLTGLQYLILANNSLAGEIPSSLINSSQSLRVLHLSNNQLHGGFPSFLKKCTSIITLALDHNNLSGEIPSWVGETMISLKILTLKANNFTGNLPLLPNLTLLHFLDLSQNSFVGRIPQSYGNLTGMTNYSGRISNSMLDVGYQVIIKIIVFTKGIEIQFGAILSSFKFIDLSTNNLSGPIPKEIVNLAGLQDLDLSYNNLSGEIPSDIGRMRSLESLDLSRNELIGSIPPSLSTIDFLGSLNLSHNNLSGKIPYASHLTTFNDPSIYASNLNLCGTPLDNNCTSEEPTSNSEADDQEDDDNDSPPIWFCIGLMPGFVVGFWIVWGILLFKKEWRYVYFKYIDHMYDMMYVKVIVTVNKIKRKLFAM